MTGRLALLMVLGAVAACDAPPQAAAPVPPPAPEEPAAVLSSAQISERSRKCATKAREDFRREWPASAATTADFASHYNSKLDTCFYLLTVHRGEKISRTLLDINENEIYGEFLGPAAADWPAAAFPDICKVAGLHCASGREWQVLAGPFMER